MISKMRDSFIYSFRGLVAVWKEERNFKIEVAVAVVVSFCLFYFDFTIFESLFCILAIALVLISEIINTIVEDLCNKIEPNQDGVIGKIKDMAAAFVLLSVISSVIIGVLVFRSHFS